MFVNFIIENKSGKEVKHLLPVGKEASDFAYKMDLRGYKWRLGKVEY